jgi:hypothetical protein
MDEIGPFPATAKSKHGQLRAERKKAGEAIDVETCEMDSREVTYCDWYGSDPDPLWEGETCQARFVRSKATDGWVCAYDLPEEKRKALYARMEREGIAITELEEKMRWEDGRREAGKRIDIETCERTYFYAGWPDVYGIGLPNYNCGDRILFVRSSEEDGWVCVGVFPEEKQKALDARISRERAANAIKFAREKAIGDALQKTDATQSSFNGDDDGLPF